MMKLEVHQLDLRYEELRTRSPARERRLLASLAEVGQKTPVVVVAGDRDGRYVLVDGYKRERALRKLHADLVIATCWDLCEGEALLLERLMREGDSSSALEQGWFLREQVTRFGLSAEELARRFERSQSWVSERLGLVRELPQAIQEAVRKGAIGAHAAMRYLVPFARANRSECLRFTEAIVLLRPTSRQLGDLYAAYRDGEPKTRELVLRDPALVLRAQEESRRARAGDKKPAALLLADLGALGGIARRAHRRLQKGLAQELLVAERQEVARCFLAVRTDAEGLFRRVEKEVVDAGPRDQESNPATA